MTIEIIREQDSISCGPNHVVIPLSICTDYRIHAFEIISATDEYIVVDESLICNNQPIVRIHHIHDFRRNSEGIIEQSHDKTYNKACLGEWWGLKIRTGLDFDQHPGNIEIHNHLPGREPRYQTDRVLITKSNKLLVNVDVFGWISPKLIANKYVSKEMQNEIRMAKSILKFV